LLSWKPVGHEPYDAHVGLSTQQFKAAQSACGQVIVFLFAMSCIVEEGHVKVLQDWFKSQQSDCAQVLPKH
jgi:hypothetical protein